MNGIRWSKIEEQHDTIIIICSGPSLTGFNFNLLKDLGYIITVNDSGNYIPFADLWFTLDPWGLNGKQLPCNFKGQHYAAVPDDYATNEAKCMTHRTVPRNVMKFLHRIPFHTASNYTNNDYLTWGLNCDPSCINTGNSGYGALNLAFHMKPKRIVFFGLDASQGYFFDISKTTRSLDHLPLIFKSTLQQLKDNNIEVINASPNSRITCFPRYTIDDALNKLREWKL